MFVYLAVTHLGGAGVWVACSCSPITGRSATPARSPRRAGRRRWCRRGAVGFGTKAGLMPLHSWLPRAHPVAPAHMSALMSGVMIKVALYGLIRVLFEWLGADAALDRALAARRWALVSALGGVLYALVQHDLKRLLAFHSIENVGIIVLGLGASLAVRARRRAAVGARSRSRRRCCTCSTTRSSRRCCSSAPARSSARSAALELDRLGGLLRRMPWTGGAFLVGSMAIAGLPPLNGFASEWLTLQALLHVALDPPVGVALVAGALALAGAGRDRGAGAAAASSRSSGWSLLGRRAAAAACASGRAAAAACAPGWSRSRCCASCSALVPGPARPDAGRAGARGDATPPVRHAGLTVPGTGSLPALGLAVALLVLIAALILAARGSRRRRARAGVGLRAARRRRRWAGLGRLHQAAAARARGGAAARAARSRSCEERGVVQGSPTHGEVPHLFDTLLYEPTMRAGAARRGASRGGCSPAACAPTPLYLLALVLALLALVALGALG